MHITATQLSGAALIEPDRLADDRGWFARIYCEREFAAHGLPSRMVQTNRSLTRRAGTLRGMHYQLAPHGEDKLVRCEHGAIWDAIVDLRPDSPTFKQWFGAELSAENRRMMYVPRGFAHGFVTLEDDTEAFYLVSAYYAPESERGLRYNDPAIGVEWPVSPTEVSEKDAKWPDLDEAFHGIERMRSCK